MFLPSCFFSAGCCPPCYARCRNQEKNVVEFQAKEELIKVVSGVFMMFFCFSFANFQKNIVSLRLDYDLNCAEVAWIHERMKRYCVDKKVYPPSFLLKTSFLFRKK